MHNSEFSSNPVPRISWEAIKLGDLIGNGSFGDVYRGNCGGRDVAVKVLQLKTLPEHLVRDFDNETRIMWQCQFDNIAGLYGICIEPGHYSIVMENLTQGSLYQFLHNPQQAISEQLLWQLAIDIAEGLAYLHDKNILHRDLKSNNVLLNDNYRAKISDFGLSKIKLETSSTSTTARRVGTVRWKAPELFKRRVEPSKASDVYSYGMILWELVTRKLPYSDASDEITVASWIKDGEQETIPDDCPKELKEIITACWADTQHRPQVKDIVDKLKQARRTLEATFSPQKRVNFGNKSWHFQTKIPVDIIEDYSLMPAGPEDYQKVLACYSHHPVPGYEINTIEIIFNPDMDRGFYSRLKTLQARNNNPAFLPTWETEGSIEERKQKNKITTLNSKLAAPHADQEFPQVKLLPLWHGTKDEVLPSIFTAGYANLATTDSGYFGKGIYSTHEAEYAYRVYSSGSLILNWVSMFSAYPVTIMDFPNLKGKGNHGNYDAHFTLVVPVSDNPREINYVPCASNQSHKYTEVTVFESAQCLPRYLVRLQAALMKSPPSNAHSRATDEEGLSKEISKLTVTTPSSTPLLFAAGHKAAPLVATTSAAHQPYIITPRTQQELAQFLHHIGFGEQDEAEAMLRIKPQLATLAGDLTDCADRKFEKITGFQYAVWALDYHMWTMLKKYLNTEEARAQIAGLHSGAWISTLGPQISWNSLIVALDTYVKNCGTWDWNKCNNYWCQQVGGAQLILPAHVINEYSHPSRPFYPCPKWNGQGEPNLPRTGVTDWRKSGSYELGRTFAWCRANLGGCVGPCDIVMFCVGTLSYDHAACVELLKSRTEQAQALVSELTLRPGSTPRP